MTAIPVEAETASGPVAGSTTVLRSHVTEEVRAGLHPSRVASKLLATLNDKTCRALAYAWIESEAWGIRNRIEYEIRRASLTPAAPTEGSTLSPQERQQAYLASFGHGTRSKYESGCRCIPCVRNERRCRQAEAERSAARERAIDEANRKITEAFERLKQSWRAEWTRELLASTFGTSTGRVTWADATIADHEDHNAMVRAGILGDLRDMAQHTLAIEEIKQNGARCLGEIVSAD